MALVLAIDVFVAWVVALRGQFENLGIRECFWVGRDGEWLL